MVKPAARPRSAVPFGHTVGIDLRQEVDFEGTAFQVMDVLDFGTRYSMYIPLESKSPHAVATALMLHWCSVAGPPLILIHDLGGEFQGEMTTMCEQWGARCSVGPAEAPWQQAMVERHGAVLGDVCRMAIEEAGAVGMDEVKLICFYAALCKNRRVDRTGYSARERVFGKADRLPGSALDGFLEVENLAGDDVLRAESTYRRAMKLREASCAALVRLDHADRYRRAVSHAARPVSTNYLRRMQVFYWRRGGTRKNLKGRRIREFERWRGPGVIIGDEVNADGTKRGHWISHNGALFLVAPEHLRLATRVEQMVPGVVASMMREAAEELKDMDNELQYDDRSGITIPVEPTRPNDDNDDDAQPRPNEEQPDAEPPAPPSPERVRGGATDEVMVLSMKPSQKSKKGRELDPKLFNDREKVAFDASDKAQWENTFD
jgi:hypothetical protein